jgi:hypothetical protein
MKKKLELELISLAQEILRLNGKEDLYAMHSAAKRLYEKLTVLKFVEDHLDDLEPEIQKGDIEKKFEELANSYLNDNRLVPESNPHEEDIMTPGMETIMTMVKEMPKSETLEDILSGVLPDPVFIKRDAEKVAPKQKDIKQMYELTKTSLNDKLKGSVIIGLNDRLAFVKHLFNGNNEDFNMVLSQVNSLRSESEIKSFIEKMVKPDYNNWKGKEEYESRFLELIVVNKN